MNYPLSFNKHFIRLDTTFKDYEKTMTPIHFECPLFSDCLETIASFLPPDQIARSLSVCTLWQKVLGSKRVWMEIYCREGIPLVEGKQRNYSRDFGILKIYTFTQKMIEEVLRGPLHMPTPSQELLTIPEEVFNIFPQPPPRICQDASPKERHRFNCSLSQLPFLAVIPSSLSLCSHYLTQKPQLPVFFALKEKNTLRCVVSFYKELPLETLQIPLTPSNTQLLACHSLIQKTRQWEPSFPLFPFIFDSQEILMQRYHRRTLQLLSNYPSLSDQLPLEYSILHQPPLKRRIVLVTHTPINQDCGRTLLPLHQEDLAEDLRIYSLLCDVIHFYALGKFYDFPYGELEFFNKTFYSIEETFPS